MEDNVDALVRAFASDDDDAIVAADEGGVVRPATLVTVRVVLLRMHWGIYSTDCALLLFPYPA